jgi:hypothetical protein
LTRDQGHEQLREKFFILESIAQIKHEPKADMVNRKDNPFAKIEHIAEQPIWIVD